LFQNDQLNKGPIGDAPAKGENSRPTKNRPLNGKDKEPNLGRPCKTFNSAQRESTLLVKRSPI